MITEKKTFGGKISNKFIRQKTHLYVVDMMCGCVYFMSSTAIRDICGKEMKICMQ